MDLWLIVILWGAALLVVAFALDDEVDYPDWLQEAPHPVRVTLNAVFLFVIAGFLLPIGLGIAGTFWQIVTSIAFILAVTWLVFIGLPSAVISFFQTAWERITRGLHRLFKPRIAKKTRQEIHQTYQDWRDRLEGNEVFPPKGSTKHETAMFGALMFEYMPTSEVSTGWVEMYRHIIWSDLYPFLQLPEDEGLQSLAEYVVWKKDETQSEADEEWLRAQIHEGLERAREKGQEELISEVQDRGQDEFRPRWLKFVD